jgi:hypothetical protein
MTTDGHARGVPRFYLLLLYTIGKPGKFLLVGSSTSGRLVWG